MKLEGTIIRKTFSFSKKNQDILPHIEKQSNQSDYLANLVRADMQKKKDTVMTKEQVASIVNEILKTHKVNIDSIQSIPEDFPMESVMGIVNMEVDVDG